MPPDFVQWLAMMKLQEDEDSMDEEHFALALLFLIIKLLHEFQHEATFQFLILRDAPSASTIAAPIEQTESMPLISAQFDAEVTSDVASPQGQPRGAIHTPERVGSMLVDGVPRGDSGYRLEEVLLGGRLRHRTLYKRPDFAVHSTISVFCSCPDLSSRHSPY